MVNRSALFVALLALCIVCASAASLAQRPGNLTYTVDHEWAQIAINHDGTIDLTYNITLTITSGTFGAFDVGQPNGDFTIGQAKDQYGNPLTHTTLHRQQLWRRCPCSRIPLNVRRQSSGIQVTTNVAGMIY